MSNITDIVGNFYRGIHLDDVDLLKLNRWARKGVEALAGGGPHFYLTRVELRRIHETTEGWIQSRREI